MKRGKSYQLRGLAIVALTLPTISGKAVKLGLGDGDDRDRGYRASLQDENKLGKYLRRQLTREMKLTRGSAQLKIILPCY